MKSSKNKGDLLEITTYVLEKSMTDNSNTVIKSKYKLKDRDGVEREIDLYAETVVNGKVLKYAFECKNHKRGVQLNNIVDFHSKITDLGIKGYFVTTSNYQKGAVEKAKALSIDLLKLKKRELNPEGIKGLISFTKHFKVEEVKVFGTKPSPDLDMNEVFEKCDKCKSSILKVVEGEVIPFLEPRLDEAMEKIYPGVGNIKNISMILGEKKGKSIGLLATFNEGAKIIHKGIPIPYHMILLKLKVWHQLFEHKVKNTNTYSYLKNNDEGLMATFSIAEFIIENHNLIACITKVEGGTNTLSFGSAQKTSKINIQEAVCLGTIDELGLKEFLSQDEDEH